MPDRARRVAVVTQAGIDVEVDPGVEHRTFLIERGEEAKNLAAVEALCRAWSQWGLTRNDVVVAVGGGMVTDVAGFAAAVYHRGVDVVHVPTTLLGQVDAAIGGKTGVNLPEGKNLVGAYWQPRAVLCDTDAPGHAAAPRAAQRPGRGGQVPLPRRRRFGSTPVERCPLDEQVARCVQIKAAVVAGDEREGGGRAMLNYGHTLGHALEIAGGFDLRHGEAVAIGLVFAAELARAAGPHRRRPGGRAPPGGGRLRPAGRAAGRRRSRRAGRPDRPGQEGARRGDLRARRPDGASSWSPASTAAPSTPRSPP